MSSVTFDQIEQNMPRMIEGQKVQGIVVKKVETGVLIDCVDGMFTGIILQKEVRDLIRNGVDLSMGATIEAELINPSIKHKE
ncbi:hypothetical protein KAZ93_01220 [Patescibacteria group bacterium]|nr:hypothetical protein [Patescibacteria group bacterium]